MKKYVANTAVSVSVTLQNGGNARVSFSALTDGSSVYYTNDKEIQHALEHHYKFGKLFRLEETEEQAAPTAKKPTAKSPAKKNTGKKSSKKETPEQTAEEIAKEWEEFNPEDEADSANEESESEEDQEEGEAELKEVTVSDLDAAKDYLAENFDIVRTKLKTEEIINDTAASLGVVFKYL